ncbi:MAG: hypothetical protein HWN81_05335 [Candidatus Lokiarchaeota archaeon]|nr:hypothetical protein [Candidatus Lokiarchaeota archaeon]
MISFILLLIFSTWVLINRFSEGGKVEGHPLGMPRGTVRALSTIMIVAFPFGYLLTGEAIPSLIVNVIFVVVAFYFEARRSKEENISQIVDEMKNPNIIIQDVKTQKYPLYLPKYSVRFLLVLLLFVTLITYYIVPKVPFEATNTIFDLLIIIILFIIGASFRSIANSRERKKIKEKIANMDASLTEVEIVEKLRLEETSWLKRKGRNILSTIMFIIVVISLICFTFDWNVLIFELQDYELSVVGLLLLLINAYYGFRD